MADKLHDEALDYHRYPTPGKLAVVATKPLTNQHDLSLAYSPGVAAASLLIVLALLAAVFVQMRRIDRSPYGRVLRAIREDAQVAQVAQTLEPTITALLEVLLLLETLQHSVVEQDTEVDLRQVVHELVVLHKYLIQQLLLAVTAVADTGHKATVVLVAPTAERS